MPSFCESYFSNEEILKMLARRAVEA